MNTNKKNFYLNLIGILLILFFMIRIIFLTKDGILVHFFWVCNHAVLILGIAILLQSHFWILAEISVALAGVLIWGLDWFSKVLFDLHLMGTTDYLFPIADKAYFITTSVLHLLSVPLAIIAFFLIGKKSKNSWKGALAHILILVPFSIYFGKFYNLNCLLEPCVTILPNFTLYPIFFLAGYFTLFVLPINYLFNKLVSKKINKPIRKNS